MCPARCILSMVKFLLNSVDPRNVPFFEVFLLFSIIFKIFFCETIIQIFTKLCSFRYCALKYWIFYLWKTWLSLNIYFFQKVFNEKDFWLGLKYSAHFNLTMEIFSWISLNFLGVTVLFYVTFCFLVLSFLKICCSETSGAKVLKLYRDDDLTVLYKWFNFCDAQMSQWIAGAI